MGEKLTLIGGTYDYEYADSEEKWELVRYDKEAEEWECMGVYCDNELFAHELKDLLNKTKGDDMWYRVKVDEDRFFVDEATLADMKTDGKKFEVETTNKWLEGVVREFPSDIYSDGMVLDEVIKLIDEGKCNV